LEQATRAETEGKRAGADTGGGAGQVLINPVGHEARSRCGYTRRARKGEAGKSKEQPQRQKAECRIVVSEKEVGGANLTARGSPNRKTMRFNQGRESKTSLKWDLSNLSREQWEESLDPGQDDVFSGGLLFSPEKRKEADRSKQDVASSYESLLTWISFAFKWEAGRRKMGNEVSFGRQRKYGRIVQAVNGNLV
jgi:hypothetical protein